MQRLYSIGAMEYEMRRLFSLDVYHLIIPRGAGRGMMYCTLIVWKERASEDCLLLYPVDYRLSIFIISSTFVLLLFIKWTFFGHSVVKRERETGICTHS